MLQHRSILEVLIWLPFEDVALSVSHVSRTWQHISSEDELWTAIAEANGVELAPQHREERKKKTFRRILKQKMLLPILSSDTLTLFNCMTQRRKTKPLSSPILVDSNSAFLFLKDSSLLICGGGRGWSTAYRIWTSGQTQQLPSMHGQRKAPGLALSGLEAFVFGGWGLKTSEKLTLDTHWSVVPDMPSEKLEFCPCTHQHIIYLCGGHSESLAFNTLTEQYSYLSVSCQDRCYTLYSEGTILIITTSSLFTYNLLTQETTKLPHDQWGYGGICVRPVLHRNALWATLGKAVLRLDLFSLQTDLYEA
jgi:hypothetical protein